jgi:hypothetical protein
LLSVSNDFTIIPVSAFTSFAEIPLNLSSSLSLAPFPLLSNQAVPVTLYVLTTSLTDVFPD